MLVDLVVDLPEPFARFRSGLVQRLACVLAIVDQFGVPGGGFEGGVCPLEVRLAQPALVDRLECVLEGAASLEIVG